MSSFIGLRETQILKKKGRKLGGLLSTCGCDMMKFGKENEEKDGFKETSKEQPLKLYICSVSAER